jgi:hypothetical protein
LNAEITVETAIVRANWRKNCPVMPLMNANVARLQRLGPVTPARSEHRHADLTVEDVLPLVGGLSEILRRVGHGVARPVQRPGAVTTPATGCMHLGKQITTRLVG